MKSFCIFQAANGLYPCRLLTLALVLLLSIAFSACRQDDAAASTPTASNTQDDVADESIEIDFMEDIPPTSTPEFSISGYIHNPSSKPIVIVAFLNSEVVSPLEMDVDDDLFMIESLLEEGDNLLTVFAIDENGVMDTATTVINLKTSPV